ncbi:MAG: mechanosensitive ion channel family protein [Actinomycetota bacterium]|nr:mechanosensitive ion channel family protein [Actinomycetota bacterium]
MTKSSDVEISGTTNRADGSRWGRRLRFHDCRVAMTVATAVGLALILLGVTFTDSSTAMAGPVEPSIFPESAATAEGHEGGLAAGEVAQFSQSTLLLTTSPALAVQVPSDSPPAEVTVSEEPGTCTSQGSLCERIFDWTGNAALAEMASWLLGTPLQIVFILLLAMLANRFSRRAIRRIVERIEDVDVSNVLVSDASARRTGERASSIGSLLRSTASVVISTIAIIWVLDVLGVSIVPLIASLGIAGLAIGFGAQSFVEDMIAGVMLLVEDQFAIGDRVDIGVVEGTVERLTLRSTVILSSDGVPWYVPNSEIRRVANESQHKSRARVRVGVSYSTDLLAAVSTFHQATVELVSEERWQEAGAQEVPPPIVAELGDSAVVLEVRVFIESSNRRPLERALRAKLLQAAATANIELPN